MQTLSLAKKQGSWHEDNIMTRQPYRILVVDDEADIMLSLKIVLENSGFNTSICRPHFSIEEFYYRFL